MVSLNISSLHRCHPKRDVDSMMLQQCNDAATAILLSRAGFSLAFYSSDTHAISQIEFVRFAIKTLVSPLGTRYDQFLMASTLVWAGFSGEASVGTITVT